MSGINLQALKDELTSGHPVTGAYDADDATAAGQLNALNRSRNKSSLTGDEVFTATDATEMSGLSDHKRELWVSWSTKTSIDPFNSKNVAFVQWIFGAGSDTVTNLQALRVESISRATEIADTLEWSGEITDVHVGNARAL